MGELIDTSIWVDFFRHETPAPIRELARSLVTRAEVVTGEPIWLELLQGVPKKRLRLVENFFETVPMVSTPLSLWREALPLARACHEAGHPVSTLDVLIAALAAHHGLRLVTFDRDFGVLAEHAGVKMEIISRPP